MNDSLAARWQIVWGIARAELRLMRRLVRYWLFVGLASLLWMASYLYYAVLHIFFSSYSPSVGSVRPAYLTSSFGFYYLVMLLFGLVFLAFDVRSRDRRERVAEVVDARPVTNLQLLSGRGLGLLLASWIPVVVVSLLLVVIGLLIGEPVEPVSLSALVTLVALPTLAFGIALIYLLAVVVRHRLLVAVLALAVFGGDLVLLFFQPIYRVQALELTGIFNYPLVSEILPQFANGGVLLHQFGLLLAAAGLLVLTATAWPRRDGGERGRRAGTGALLLVAGIACWGLLLGQRTAAVELRETRAAAHEARRGDAAPDVETVTGRVAVFPGDRLELDLDLRLRAPVADGGASLEKALFTFNPGLEVETLTDAAGQALSFTHDLGLLTVTLPRRLPPGEAAELHLTASGRPDQDFAYLDGVVHPAAQTGRESQIFLLGQETSIFESDFVVLTPALRWLPAAGADFGRGAPGGAPEDFFDLDLTLELPAGWQAAGPGRRQEATAEGPTSENQGRTAFRFAPPAPLPEAAVVAGPLVGRSATVDGGGGTVELEVLMHPDHAGLFDSLELTGGTIRDYVGERLREATDLGLPYPYDALTLVEVPNSLRSFGGGWRLDSALAAPALLMIKESSLPTARIEKALERLQGQGQDEDAAGRRQLALLQRFFENDFNGGNLFVGAARNFWSYQTAPRGPASLALDFVAQDLVRRVVTEKEGFFSAHVFGGDLNAVAGAAIVGILQGSGQPIAESVRQAVTDRPAVWEEALEVPLRQLEPWQEPRMTLDLLTLKGGAIARWLEDGLGRTQAAALLAELRRRHRGETFDREDLLAAAQDLGVSMDLGPSLGNWLDSAALPGLEVGPVDLLRLPDDDEGRERYQLLVTVHNGEPTPGLFHLSWQVADGNGDAGGSAESRQSTAPLQIGGGETLEVGVVTSKPPRQLRLEPYLSLNRGPFQLSLPPLPNEPRAGVEPFQGSRPTDWQPAGGDLVVDDLDPGFAIEQDADRGGLAGMRLGGQGQDGEQDQGLPVLRFGQPSAAWARTKSEAAYGRYRHTYAAVRAGQGERRAIFAAQLPTAGRWRLAYHLPWQGTGGPGGANDFNWRQGAYSLSVVDSAGDRHELELDAAAATGGWTDLGELDLPAGEVRLEVSDQSTGRAVVADAIRWRPAVGPEAESPDEAGEEAGDG